MKISKYLNSSESAQITNDGILFPSIIDLKYFVEDIIFDLINKHTISSLGGKYILNKAAGEEEKKRNEYITGDN